MIVQVVETFGKGVTPIFVDKLDAIDIAKKPKLPNTPVIRCYWCKGRGRGLFS